MINSEFHTNELNQQQNENEKKRSEKTFAWRKLFNLVNLLLLASFWRGECATPSPISSHLTHNRPPKQPSYRSQPNVFTKFTLIFNINNGLKSYLPRSLLLSTWRCMERNNDWDHSVSNHTTILAVVTNTRDIRSKMCSYNKMSRCYKHLFRVS